jgi:hypothetical protein
VCSTGGGRQASIPHAAAPSRTRFPICPSHLCSCADGENDDGGGDGGGADDGVVAQRTSKAAFADGDAEAALTKLHGGPVAGLDSVPVALKAAAGVIAKGRLVEVATAAEAAAGAAGGDNQDGAGAGSGSSSAAAAGGGHQPPGAPGSYAVAVRGLAEFLRLDGAAIRALNLLPSKRDAVAVPVPSSGAGAGAGAGGKSAATVAGITSLYGLLSYHARTPGGRRLLKAWMLQPLTDAGEIARRQDVVQAFVESPSLRSGWKQAVALDDVAPLAARLQPGAKRRGGASGGLVDLVKMRQMVGVLPSVARLAGDGYEGGDGQPQQAEALKAALAPHAAAASALQARFAGFLSEYAASVDDSDARRPRLRPEVDPELTELAEAVSDARESIKAYHEECAAEWPAEVSGDLRCLYDSAKGGWIFRGKKAAEKAIRSLPGADIRAVLKDGIYFSTRGSGGLDALGSALGDAEEAYADRSRALMEPLMDSARACLPDLEALQAQVAQLDAFYALAEVAACGAGSWVRPTVTPPAAGGAGGDILVVGGRHPVIEMQEAVASFIPNDYTLRRSQGRFQIITGAYAVPEQAEGSVVRGPLATHASLSPSSDPPPDSTPCLLQVPTQAASRCTSARWACWRCWRRWARTCPPRAPRCPCLTASPRASARGTSAWRGWYWW